MARTTRLKLLQGKRDLQENKKKRLQYGYSDTLTLQAWPTGPMQDHEQRW